MFIKFHLQHYNTEIKNRTILYFTYLNKQIINRNSKNLEYKQEHMNLFQMSNINRLEMGNNSGIQYLVYPQAKDKKKKKNVCVCLMTLAARFVFLNSMR